MNLLLEDSNRRWSGVVGNLWVMAQQTGFLAGGSLQVLHRLVCSWISKKGQRIISQSWLLWLAPLAVCLGRSLDCRAWGPGCWNSQTLVLDLCPSTLTTVPSWESDLKTLTATEIHASPWFLALYSVLVTQSQCIRHMRKPMLLL